MCQQQLATKLVGGGGQRVGPTPKPKIHAFPKTDLDSRKLNQSKEH